MDSFSELLYLAPLLLVLFFIILVFSKRGLLAGLKTVLWVVGGFTLGWIIAGLIGRIFCQENDWGCGVGFGLFIGLPIMTVGGIIGLLIGFTTTRKR